MSNDAVVEVKEQGSNIHIEDALFINKVKAASSQTSGHLMTSLLSNFAGAIIDGQVEKKDSLLSTINDAIASIDMKISEQLAQVMHEENFLKLEGSWRGLQYLVNSSITSASLKIKLMSLSFKDLKKDLNTASDFDQSQLFQKVYEDTFGTPGGEPFGALIGDYEFSNHPEDIDTLRNISQVSAASFSPFIASASSKLSGFESWSDLLKSRDVSRIFDTAEYTKWRSFRESDDSRFVSLTLPRVLARLPYGSATKPVDGFDFEETLAYSDNPSEIMDHQNYCWMSAAYPMAVNIMDAQSKYGWTTAIRGAESGGRVENLPLHCFRSDDGDIDAKCPTEVAITDRREAELGKLGFLPLSHYKDTDYAVFFGGQSTQKPKRYDTAAANENAQIATRLPYILATSRFAHYLKVMARDKIGSFMEAEDCERWLNRWIKGYVNGNAGSNQALKAKYPLADAKVEVQNIPGKPGSYRAVAWMRPWLQFEELTASLRLVANLPEGKG